MKLNQELSETIKLQQAASDPLNSAWVFASAGSGKTKILTDRVLRLLLSGVSFNKILCLTFTKAAASEMQHRINENLKQWLLCSNSDLSKKLSDLLGQQASDVEIKRAQNLFIQLLDSEFPIAIQTIHAFCQNILKTFPFETKISPTFEIIDDAKKNELFLKAKKKVLNQALNDSDLKLEIEIISEKISENSLSELVLELFSKKEELENLKSEFGEIEGIVKQIYQHCSIKLSDDEEKIFAEFLEKIDLKIINHLVFELENKGGKSDIKIAENIKVFLQKPSLANFTSHYYEAFFTKENEARKFGKKISEDENLISIIERQIELILEFNEKLNSYKICRTTAALLRFCDRILAIYSDSKKRDGLLDYGDLISYTNKLLLDHNFSDWIRLKMDNLFDHILVDESQDTNWQQWHIIKAISDDFFSGFGAKDNKNRSIFVVGDDKQSIYSFQGAQPNISEENYRYFNDKITSSAQKLQRIDLSNSFRSLSQILDAVNDCFADNKITIGSEFKKHKPIRKESEGRVEIWPQIYLQRDEEKTYKWNIANAANEELALAEIMAQLVAKKIKFWLDNGKMLPARNRAIKAGDIMILLRQRSNEIDLKIAQALQQQNISFSSATKLKISDSQAIHDLLNCARFSLLESDDFTLFHLLQSPLFSLSQEDLLKICAIKNDRKINLISALKTFDEFQQIVISLKNLITTATSCSSFDFFYRLISDQKIRNNFSTYYGVACLEILDQFLLEVFNLSINYSRNLQKFLEYVDKNEMQLNLSSQQNSAVKIATIHSAKGLQAPIVIMLDCCFNFFRLRNFKEKISWLNFDGNNLPLWCEKKEDENILVTQHRQQKIQSAKEEYNRLLYVAMTRAEDELYIAGFGKDNAVDCWYNIIKSSLQNRMSQEQFLDEDELQQMLKANSAFKFTDNNVMVCGYSQQYLGKIDKGKTGIAETTKKITPQQNVITNALPQFLAAKNDISFAQRQAQSRGKTVHKILEIFGKYHNSNKEFLMLLAQRIIDENRDLSESNKNNISQQIHNFLYSPQFNELFNGEIKCEVEISYDNKIYRIDLLRIQENQLLIVDYKTDEFTTNDIPQSYLKQLKDYKKALTSLYSNHQMPIQIRAAIFWTEQQKLQIID